MEQTADISIQKVRIVIREVIIMEIASTYESIGLFQWQIVLISVSFDILQQMTIHFIFNTENYSVSSLVANNVASKGYAMILLHLNLFKQ